MSDLDNSAKSYSKTLREETFASTNTKSMRKEPRVTPILQGLLEEHKAQSLIVKSLKEELDHLEQNPLLYFQNRRSFLYSAYTQTLDECLLQMKFDVKVCLRLVLTNFRVDAGCAISDREVGLVFGHVYQINPREALNGN